jgi:ribosomal protein S18 acetylase RimI-like enzyme
LPDYAGQGLGQALTRAFLARARQNGARIVYLTTDTDNNERVNRFYDRLGFILQRTFEAPGPRTMNEYIYPLDKEEPL